MSPVIPAMAQRQHDALAQLRLEVLDSPARAVRTPYLQLDVDRVVGQLRRMRLAMPAVAVH